MKTDNKEEIQNKEVEPLPADSDSEITETLEDRPRFKNIKAVLGIIVAIVTIIGGVLGVWLSIHQRPGLRSEDIYVYIYTEDYLGKEQELDYKESFINGFFLVVEVTNMTDVTLELKNIDIVTSIEQIDDPPMVSPCFYEDDGKLFLRVYNRSRSDIDSVSFLIRTSKANSKFIPNSFITEGTISDIQTDSFIDVLIFDFSEEFPSKSSDIPVGLYFEFSVNGENIPVFLPPFEYGQSKSIAFIPVSSISVVAV